ncbi:MAG: polysaccharide biosynthesis tyrosine autokinase [Mariniblastus sp.]
MDTHPHNAPQPYMVAQQAAPEESGFDFWGVLNRRKWLVFLGLLTGMLLGGLYHAQCDTIYKSEAKVRIEPKDPFIFSLNGGSQRNGLMPTAADLNIRHDQLIGEFNIVKKCLNENDLLTLKSFESLPNDEIIPEVRSNLEVTQNKEEPILYDLVFYGPEPDDARVILDLLIATYQENLMTTYNDDTQQVEMLLKTVYDQFVERSEELQDELNEVFENNDITYIAQGKLTLHHQKIVELADLLEQDRRQIKILSSDLARSKESLALGSEAVKQRVWSLIADGILKEPQKKQTSEDRQGERIATQLRETEMAKKRLEKRFGPSHPDVEILTDQIADLEVELETALLGKTEEVTSGPSAEEMLRWHVSSLSEKISDLEESIMINDQLLTYNQERASSIETVKRKVENIKERQAEHNEFLQAARKKLVEIGSGEAEGRNRHEGFRFQVLMNATYGQDVWPILPVILGIGGLLGSLLGFGLGCLVELADKTFHNPDEIMKQLNVPLIGHVPVIGTSKRYLVENSLIEPIICTYHRPKSQVSEAFRAVRTALYFNTQGKQHSVIQVTSPTPGDGKSTLASNLAVSIAQSGKSVLLVDADMRRPRQHETFGISSKSGFATVLSGVDAWRKVMFECEEIPGLTLMPCGAKPQNPAELSSSPQVKELIEEMRSEFDFVIIDTPPLLAVTDPCPIAARVDGVILCLRIKKNVRVSAERAIDMIANLGANCIGLVVNGVGAQSGYGSQYTYGAYRAGYSYNGYGYGYGYGYGAGGKYYDEDQKGRKASVGAPKHLENQRTGQHQGQQPPVA